MNDLVVVTFGLLIGAERVASRDELVFGAFHEETRGCSFGLFLLNHPFNLKLITLDFFTETLIRRGFDTYFLLLSVNVPLARVPNAHPDNSNKITNILIN